jgi:hypothetical protein
MSNIIKDSRVVCRCGDARPACTFFKLPEGFRPVAIPYVFVLTLVPAHAHVHALPSALPQPSVAHLMSAAPYVNKGMTRQQSAAAAKKAQKQVANAAALAVAEKQKAAPRPAKKASV